MQAFQDLTREQLLEVVQMFAKNWLAHDGCWFLAAEESGGLDRAMDLDRDAWQRFAAVEARRIKEFAGLGDEGGLVALETALGLRMYAALNRQHTEWNAERTVLRFSMDSCRVHTARERKGLPRFPCKAIGEVEFPTFAATIDARIQTRCLRCPPDAAAGQYCGWEFSLRG
ncbi:MAG: DUF6125 family protein [Candidatus Krumholzibacteriia bacterium]